MKPLTTLFVALLAVILGYMSEPSLRSVLTAGIPEDPSSAEPIRPRQLQTITITGRIVFHDAAAGRMVSLEPGTEVTLLRVEDNQAIVLASGTESPVAVDVSLTSLAGPPPPVPEPGPEAEPDPEPEPEPEPDIDEDPATTSHEEIARIMRQSIIDRQIRAFEEDQINEWLAGPDEIHDGETYQTGTVTYEEELLFGDKTVTAKALIKDGKVVRWTWPELGMDIK